MLRKLETPTAEAVAELVVVCPAAQAGITTRTAAVRRRDRRGSGIRTLTERAGKPRDIRLYKTADGGRSALLAFAYSSCWPVRGDEGGARADPEASAAGSDAEPLLACVYVSLLDEVW
jgi:hypothetical protein